MRLRRTTALLSGHWPDLLASPQPMAEEIRMTENEAVEIAKGIAAEKGWTWLTPTVVRNRRRWFRFVGWSVRSNAESLGCNVVVELDVDVTKGTYRVVRAVYWPR